MEKKEVKTRTEAIECIKLSIGNCRTFEQLTTTTKLIDNYYKQYAFESGYLQQEWVMDNQLRDRKAYLTMLDNESYDVQPGNFEKPSLRRLNEYMKAHTINELQAEWAELKEQLDRMELTMHDLELYPFLYEKLIYLKTPARYTHRRIDDLHTIVGRWFGYSTVKAS